MISRSLVSVLIGVFLLFATVSTAQAATYGDLNCDGIIDVLDVVLSINIALQIDLAEELDPNGNNIVDACEPYVAEVSCGTDTVLNGAGDGCEIAPGVLEAVFADGVASVEPASFCGEGTTLLDLSCVVDTTQIACPQDCAGVWGGANVTDNCGNCDADPSNDCTTDCAGDWGGSAYTDPCGNCDVDPTNDCAEDCAGVPGGSSITNECGDCYDPNATESGFSTDWVYQEGTMEQYTRCESLAADSNGNAGFNCINPEIKYGTVEGGVPQQHSGNDYDLWCQQLGFDGSSGVTYGTRSPCAGAVFGGSGWDEGGWHWCDWQDGDWYNESLDMPCTNGEMVTSIECHGGSSGPVIPECNQDCAGDWGGDAYADGCGTCDADPTNDCVLDCAGDWGGSAYTDACGNCDADPTNDCAEDCAGVPGGTSVTNECGDCYDPNAIGTGFSTDWVYQEGTMEQYTRCESLAADSNGNAGFNCINPEIKYGTVEGGVPQQHSGNDYDLWCQQLGFDGSSGVTYGTRSPCAGAVFGGSGWDEGGWHWCDWQDGDWYNESLDMPCTNGEMVTSIECHGGSFPPVIPECP